MEVAVEVEGPSEDVRMRWDAQTLGLVRAGNKYTAEFEAGTGAHIYSITVFGAPGEKWKATVETGERKHQHEGHMSPSGSDTTGDTPFAV